jgi:hypothetical protein
VTVGDGDANTQVMKTVVTARAVGTLRGAGAAVSLALLVACGGSGKGGFLSIGDRSPAVQGDGDAAISDASTTVSSDDGSGGGAIFTSSDAAPAGVMFDCQPGTYRGTFSTMVTSDAGGLFSLFSFNWTGNLSITLQGHVTNSGTGEIPQPTLTIAPGAQLAGMDTMGGHFNAELSGQLDCPSKMLTATVLNGTYNYFGDAGGVSMQGTMSASYEGTGAKPALTMGSLNLSSAQLSSLAALGTWSATLQ